MVGHLIYNQCTCNRTGPNNDIIRPRSFFRGAFENSHTERTHLLVCMGESLSVLFLSAPWKITATQVLMIINTYLPLLALFDAGVRTVQAAHFRIQYVICITLFRAQRSKGGHYVCNSTLQRSMCQSELNGRTGFGARLG